MAWRGTSSIYRQESIERAPSGGIQVAVPESCWRSEPAINYQTRISQYTTDITPIAQGRNGRIIPSSALQSSR